MCYTPGEVVRNLENQGVCITVISHENGGGANQSTTYPVLSPPPPSFTNSDLITEDIAMGHQPRIPCHVGTHSCFKFFFKRNQVYITEVVIRLDGHIEVRVNLREVGAPMYLAKSRNCTCEIPAPVLQSYRCSAGTGTARKNPG